MATQEPFVSFKRDALRAHAASSHRPWLGVSCLYEDLRALPYRASYFDAVACISTLEHVGMDNRLYGSDLPPAAEPQREAARALDERSASSHRGAPCSSPFHTAPRRITAGFDSTIARRSSRWARCEG